MRLQAECSSFESALRRLAAAGASVGDALAPDGAIVAVGMLHGSQRGGPERRSATGAPREVAAAAGGAARCSAALQQAAHCVEQPRCEEGAEAGGCRRPGAAWGPCSAAGRECESAVGCSGSAGGAATPGVGQVTGVDSRRGRPGAGWQARGVSQVWEGGELRYAAGLKPSKRCPQALHLGTFATGAPPPRSPYATRARAVEAPLPAARSNKDQDA